MFGTPTLSEDSDGVRADHWFSVERSERYYIRESCFRTSPNAVVTLLWWEDEQQIIDLAEEEERES
jgi:hypothetical protein